MRGPTKHYLQRFFPTIAAYVVLLIAVDTLFRHRSFQGAPAIALAALPAVPIIGILLIVGAYLREETDEFERSVHAESMLWGIGLTLALLTTWGFIENFAGAQHLNGYLAFPIFWGFTTIAGWVIRWRYR